MAGVVTCVALALFLAGCGDDDKKGMGDSPVLNHSGDDSPAEVFNFPDHFGNLATKCVGHGYRAYVTTNNGAPSNIEVVPDPACVSAGATASPEPGAERTPASTPTDVAPTGPGTTALATPAATSTDLAPSSK